MPSFLQNWSLMLKRTVTLPMVRYCAFCLDILVVVISYSATPRVEFWNHDSSRLWGGGRLGSVSSGFNQKHQKNTFKFDSLSLYESNCLMDFHPAGIILSQGTPYVFWENSVCFSRPGFNDTQEVRYRVKAIFYSVSGAGVYLHKGWLQ